MQTLQRSPELSNTIAALKQLDPHELVSRLKNPQFIDSWKVTASEKQAIVKAFSSDRKVTADGWWN